MSKMITLNGKKYEAAEFSYNTMADFEELGIPMGKMSTNHFATLRAYVAICMRVDKDIAGKEIEKHILNGGDMEEVAQVFSEMIEKSDFFRALSENKTEEATENTPNKRQKKDA